MALIAHHVRSAATSAAVAREEGWIVIDGPGHAPVYPPFARQVRASTGPFGTFLNLLQWRDKKPEGT